MLSAQKIVEEPLLVSRPTDINGSLFQDAIVQRNCSLHIRGNLRGSLTIESGASVIVEGSVDGRVVNKGGKLVINNRGIAEYARAEGPAEAEARGILKVNLNVIATNWEMLAKHTEAECAASLPADAYGLGVEPIAGTLAEVGCRTFFVSDLGDARRLRAAAPKATIYVLNGLYAGTAPVFAEIEARPVINSVIELAEWDVFAAGAQWTGGYALNVDTGASRLGVSMEEAAGLAARANSSAHGIKLLMSRLDNSEKPDPVLHDRQIGLLHDLRRLYGGIPASLADSSGMFIGPKAHFNVVRAGAALLGVNPTPGAANPMQAVFELRARIVQVRNLAPGETFAYDTSWAVKRATRLALVSVGYADGYPRPAGASENALQAIIGGKPCKIAGRASMDLLAIDVTDLDPAAARRGEMVTLIGEGLGVDDLASAVKSSGREILVNLGRRFHRIYYASR
jgi:alanine racemase